MNHPAIRELRAMACKLIRKRRAMSLDNLAICTMLHERVEIVYTVDGYSASLWTNDNPGRKVLEAQGDDIPNALAELNKLCAGKTWKEIRKLPSI